MTEMDKNSIQKSINKMYSEEPLSSLELLEIALSYSSAKDTAKETAKSLLYGFGSIRKIFNATASELVNCGKNIDRRTAEMFVVMGHMYRRIYVKSTMKTNFISTVFDAARYASNLYYNDRNEKLFIVSVSKNYRAVNANLVSEGTSDTSNFFPRNSVKAVLDDNVDKIVIVHNHPDGSSKPSHQDCSTTKSIIKVFGTLEIKIIDHIIVGDGCCFSFLCEFLPIPRDEDLKNVFYKSLPTLDKVHIPTIE